MNLETGDVGLKVALTDLAGNTFHVSIGTIFQATSDDEI
jgi:hypothetical protein